jgi:hypothetical protein
MRRGIGLEALLQIVERAGADKVKLQRRKAEAQHVAVRIDQAWKQRSTLGVDCRCCVRPRLSCTNYADDLAIVADEQAGEVL